ncbi:hypothetical protein FKM82_018585 [Ascaphus truei]
MHRTSDPLRSLLQTRAPECSAGIIPTRAPTGLKVLVTAQSPSDYLCRSTGHWVGFLGHWVGSPGVGESSCETSLSVSPRERDTGYYYIICK